MSLDYRLEAEAATPRFATLSHARVAFPLDLCHLASHDVDFERSVSPDTACRSLARNFVMPRRQRHPKVPLVIRGKRCDLALLIFHRERKSTRLNSSHSQISYAVFCLKKKKRIS